MLRSERHNNTEILTVPWGPDESYPFAVVHNPVKAYDKDGVAHRYKEVYLGTFVGDRAPDGLKCNVLYWLKVINTDMPAEVLRQSACREQYDLFPFKGRHFRKFLARNADAQTVMDQLRQSHRCDPLEHCCVVEPCYCALNEDSAAAIERMTVWERLEYVNQYIQALLDLRADDNRVGGRQILAHRDVKIPNGLIRRDYGSFRVILVDMATILFGGEKDAAEPAFRSVGGGPHGTNPALMSPHNSPPEMADASLPMSEKADVFALGGMLASLFGYCSNARSPEAVYCIRNPIYTWHYLRSWPTSRVNPANGGGSGDSVPPDGFTVQKFQQRYKNSIGWDRDPRNAHTSWLEAELMQENYAFRWENQTDSPYAPSPEVLEKIQILFRECTHIHPDDRLSLDRLKAGIEYLLRSVPEERNLANDSLYLADEAAYLYDLRGAGSRNVPYQIASRQAWILDSTAVRTVTYANPWDQLHDPGSMQPPVAESAFRSSADLERYLSGLDAIHRTRNGSLTDALRELYIYYHKHQDTCPFSGRIRIFSYSGFTDDCIPDIRVGQFSLSVRQLLDMLQELARDTLDVCICCPDRPRLGDDSWLRWKPLVLPTTAAAPGGKDSAAGSRRHQAPEPVREPVRDQSAAQQTPQAPPRPAHPENDYVIDSEGLFFMIDDRRYYVGKKKGR